MSRRLVLLLSCAVVACGGNANQTPAPQTMNDAVTQFLDAVKAKDWQRMTLLWGTEDGPGGVDRKNANALRMRAMSAQVFLSNRGYRLVDGPLLVPGSDNQRSYRIELRRANCSVVVPISIIKVRRGGWLVFDLHLNDVVEANKSCRPDPGDAVRP